MKLGGAALTSAILIALSLGATANPLSSCYDYSGAYDFGVDDCRSGRVIRALRDKYDELNAAADTPCGSSFFRDLKREYLPEKMQNEYDKYSTEFNRLESECEQSMK